MPNVPDGYDPVLLNHWLWWKLKCFEAQGVEFQQLFEAVMNRILDDEDRFTPIRPYGNVGDRKSDGILLRDGVVYAVYSPDEYKQAELVDKIQSDLDGAIKHWADKGLRRWVFVYNVRRGLPPDVAGILQTLRGAHPGLEMDTLNSDDLWKAVARLPLNQRCELLGAPAGYEHLFLASTTADAERLKDGAFVVVQDVMSSVNISDARQALGERVLFGPPLHARPQAEDWGLAATFQEVLIEDALQRARDLLPRFAVFSLAPIPLAIHLGFLLSDRVEVEPYQYDRDRKTWAWSEALSAPQPVQIQIRPQPHHDGAVAAVVRVSLSAPIRAQDTFPHAPGPVIEVDISVEDPDVMWLVKPEQLDELSEIIRQALKAIRGLPRCDAVHLFVAAPTGACVRIGQAINPRMNPPVILYEYARQRTPCYTAAITLSEKQQL